MGAREPADIATLTQSAEYANTIVNVAADIARTNDPVDLAWLLQRAADDLRVDAAVYSSCFGGDDTLRSYRHIFACPSAWQREYTERGLYREDPWLKYAVRNLEPARTEELQLTERERSFVRAAAAWGFAGSMVVPVPAAPARARVGALCLGSCDPEFFGDRGYPAFRLLARMIATEIGDCQLRTIGQELVKRARITAYDLLLLSHEQQGHCSKVIAAALNTEAHTIDMHFHRLRLRLGAPNRRAALRIAEIYGLL